MPDPCQVGTQLNYCGALWTVTAVIAGAGFDELWAVIKDGFGHQQTIPMSTVEAHGA